MNIYNKWNDYNNLNLNQSKEIKECSVIIANNSPFIIYYYIINL